MEMEISNVPVYGLNESAIASGYPMLTDVKNSEQEDIKKATNRLIALGQAKSGSGHDCALKGIVVQADITAPQYWWLQFGRYHFADIISSQSKMHRILKMKISEKCNRHVDPRAIELLEEMIDVYNNWIKEYGKEHIGVERKFYQRVIANCPMGLTLTARITTNYLQLKTIYFQRKKHRLEEWYIFCNWVVELPMFKEIIKKKVRE